jgi:hypothetical protein
MDTTIETADRAHDERSSGRRVGVAGTLFMAGLLCFMLPFLTVTCVGDGVTVSGLQAATKIDPGPSDQAERELTRDEPANLFAMIALGATVVGLALSFGSRRSRVELAAAAAVAVIALEGLFLYATFRSWGEAFPEVGLVAATTLLVSAGWASVGIVRRWVFAVGGIATTVLVAAAVIPYETLMRNPYLFVSFYAGGILAVTLAVGAIRRAMRPEVASAEPRQHRVGRMLLAGTLGTLLLGGAGVAAVFLMVRMLSAESAPPLVGTSIAFTLLVLALFVGASVAAWAAGDAIVRHQRRVAAVLVRAEGAIV